MMLGRLVVVAAATLALALSSTVVCAAPISGRRMIPRVGAAVAHGHSNGSFPLLVSARSPARVGAQTVGAAIAPEGFYVNLRSDLIANVFSALSLEIASTVNQDSSFPPVSGSTGSASCLRRS
jgi:hypothetical protein